MQCTNCKGNHPAAAKAICPVAQEHLRVAARAFVDRPRHFEALKKRPAKPTKQATTEAAAEVVMEIDTEAAPIAEDVAPPNEEAAPAETQPAVEQPAGPVTEQPVAPTEEQAPTLVEEGGEAANNEDCDTEMGEESQSTRQLLTRAKARAALAKVTEKKVALSTPVARHLKRKAAEREPGKKSTPARL